MAPSIVTAQAFLSDFAGQDILFLAPTRQAADDVVRSVAIQRGAVSGVHRFTLASLAIEIAGPKLAADGRSILSGVAVDALAARATEHCRAQNALNWCGPVARTPGFFRALASTIRELRIQAVDLDKLAATSPAGADLAGLARAFDAALKDAQIADLAAIYRIACSEPSPYRRMPVLVLDVNPNTVLERQFLAGIRVSGPTPAATEFQPEPVAAGALDRLRARVFSTAAPDPGI